MQDSSVLRRLGSSYESGPQTNTPQRDRTSQVVKLHLQQCNYCLPVMAWSCLHSVQCLEVGGQGSYSPPPPLVSCVSEQFTICSRHSGSHQARYFNYYRIMFISISHYDGCAADAVVLWPGSQSAPKSELIWWLLGVVSIISRSWIIKRLETCHGIRN